MPHPKALGSAPRQTTAASAPWGGEGRALEHHPDGVTTTDDWALMGAARAGDRLAFGLLYLRHHAAAWRVACVASRFSPDAELAVIEGFTRIFSALPEES